MSYLKQNFLSCSENVASRKIVRSKITLEYELNKIWIFKRQEKSISLWCPNFAGWKKILSAQ